MTAIAFRSLRAVLGNAALGAIGAGIVALAHLLARSRGIGAPVLDAMAWTGAMSLTFLPVAIASATVARAIAIHGGRWRIVVLAVAAVIAAGLGMVAYAAYMTALSPATNWDRGGWRPALACLFVFALEMLRSRRCDRAAG